MERVKRPRLLGLATSALILSALILPTMILSTEHAAAEPPPWPDFEAKFVSPPKAGETPRISVQVEPLPDVPVKRLDTSNVAEDRPVETGAFAWYWQQVRPDLAAASPARLSAALAHLSQGPGVAAPRLRDIQAIIDAYGKEILAATIGTDVSPALVLAVIGIESAGRKGAVSPKGATGLMQLMPATAARFGTTDLTDPADNIRGGVAYLDWLMGEFNGDPLLVLAGYNAGEGAVRKHQGVPPYDETRAYVPKVLAAWTVASGLCKTPPMFISDGCAFALAGRTADGDAGE